jgi:polyketide biosynthesis enoyl-CoA hydratase PksH
MALVTGLHDRLRVRFDEQICFIQLHRPEADNAIDRRLIDECHEVLRHCEHAASVVVLEGLPEVFCSGADFQEIAACPEGEAQDPGALYGLWRRLARGPYVSVAHVRGRVNAGGVGFVAACDIVLSDEKATFGLSELLFGLMPACVMPFLIRRTGLARANYLALSTRPVTARQAEAWGLVDVCDAGSDGILRSHLLRLRRLDKRAIARCKQYAAEVDDGLERSEQAALRANREVFSDPGNLAKISRFATTGRFPWDRD